MYETICVGGFLLAYLAAGMYLIWHRQTILGALAVTGLFVFGIRFAYPLFLLAAPTLVAIGIIILIVAAFA